MKRLKCNKTQFYNLAKEVLVENPPPMHKCEFQKAIGDPSYWLRWEIDGFFTEIFLTAALGKCRAQVRLERENPYTGERYLVDRHTDTVPLSILEARDMIQERKGRK